MTRHEPRPPSPHIPRYGVTIIDGTNDVKCPTCKQWVTMVTDGNGQHIGIDSDRRVHPHDVSRGPGDMG